MAQRSSHLESGGMDFKLILPFVANTVKRILARRTATLRVESNRRFYTLKKEHDPFRVVLFLCCWKIVDLHRTARLKFILFFLSFYER